MNRTIEIGGLAISLPAEKVIFDQTLRPFFSRKKTFLTVTVRSAEVPPAVSYGRYRCDGAFAVLKRDDGYLVEFEGGFVHSLKALLVDRSLRKATLFLKNPKKPVLFFQEFPWPFLLVYFLLARGLGIFVHACGIRYRGKGYLFVGPQGAGKSTLARLLSGENGFDILSDECIVVRKEGRKKTIFGTPWHSKFPSVSNQKAPLRAVFFLCHGKKNTVSRLSLSESVRRFLPEAWPRAWDPEGIPFIMRSSLDLCAEVPCYELAFVPTEEISLFVGDFVRGASKEKELS